MSLYIIRRIRDYYKEDYMLSVKAFISAIVIVILKVTLIR